MRGSKGVPMTQCTPRVANLLEVVDVKEDVRPASEV